jgi:hypothetical protein
MIVTMTVVVVIAILAPKSVLMPVGVQTAREIQTPALTRRQCRRHVEQEEWCIETLWQWRWG